MTEPLSTVPDPERAAIAKSMWTPPSFGFRTLDGVAVLGAVDPPEGHHQWWLVNIPRGASAGEVRRLVRALG